MAIKLDSQPTSEKPFSRRKFLYEGRTKSVFEGMGDDSCVLYFKDTDPQNVDQEISGKGVINNRLSCKFFHFLTQLGIPNHYIMQLNMREQLVRSAERPAFFFDIHNFACDDFVERFQCTPYAPLEQMLIEVRYNQPNPHVISPQHLVVLGLIDEDEYTMLFQFMQRINDFLLGQFLAHDLALLRYQLTFGRVYLSDHPLDTRLMLMDEISLDTCRVLDLQTNDRLDRNAAGYVEIAKRFNIIQEPNTNPFSVSPDISYFKNTLSH